MNTKGFGTLAELEAYLEQEDAAREALAAAGGMQSAELARFHDYHLEVIQMLPELQQWFIAHNRIFEFNVEMEPSLGGYFTPCAVILEGAHYPELAFVIFESLMGVNVLVVENPAHNFVQKYINQSYRPTLRHPKEPLDRSASVQELKDYLLLKLYPTERSNLRP